MCFNLFIHAGCRDDIWLEGWLNHTDFCDAVPVTSLSLWWINFAKCALLTRQISMMIKLKAFSSNLECCCCPKLRSSGISGSCLHRLSEISCLGFLLPWRQMQKMIHVWMTPLDLTAAFVLAVFFMPWSVEDVGRAALEPHSDHSGSSARNQRPYLAVKHAYTHV